MSMIYLFLIKLKAGYLLDAILIQVFNLVEFELIYFALLWIIPTT